MNLTKITEKLNPIIAKEALSLYSIKTKREFGEHFVEILLDGQKITSDQLERIHLELVEILTDEDIAPHYFLEISSAGIERPIDTQVQMESAVGAYIYLESPKYKGNGTLIALNNDIITLEINLKGRFKKIEINIKDINRMRYAVKF